MDSLLFLTALVAVAWTVIWTVMNSAKSESSARAMRASYNARARGKSQVPPQNSSDG